MEMYFHRKLETTKCLPAPNFSDPLVVFYFLAFAERVA